MKIAFIGGRTFYHPDGIATYMYNLATELVKMGHEPIVYQESDHNGEEWVNGFKVVHPKSCELECDIYLRICRGWKLFRESENEK